MPKARDLKKLKLFKKSSISNQLIKKPNKKPNKKPKKQVKLYNEISPDIFFMFLHRAIIKQLNDGLKQLNQPAQALLFLDERQERFPVFWFWWISTDAVRPLREFQHIPRPVVLILFGYDRC